MSQLTNGNILIADTDNDRVIEVQHTGTSGGTIVWQQGQTGISGSGWNQLSGPSDVEEIWQGILNQVIVKYQNMTNVSQPVVTAWVFTPFLSFSACILLHFVL